MQSVLEKISLSESRFYKKANFGHYLGDFRL